MHGQGIERGWVTATRGLSGYAVLRQCGERVGGDGVVFDGGCGQRGLVLRVYGKYLTSPFPSLPPVKM